MAANAPRLKLITSEVDPDLAEVKSFIKARLAEGAFAVLIAAILALLARMRDLNTELLKRIEASRAQASAERNASPTADGTAVLGKAG